MKNDRHTPPTDRGDFQVAILCALRVESSAVEVVVDEFWPIDYGKAAGDTNAYAFGRIGAHNVVLVYLSGIGKICAAQAAACLRSSFTNVRLALLVGICGGVPSNGGTDTISEIFLGDVVISTGIVQYDFGRQFLDGLHRKTGFMEILSRPNTEVRSILHRIESNQGEALLLERLHSYLKEIVQNNQSVDFGLDRLEEDVVYPSEYIHKHRQSDACTICATSDDSVCHWAREASCNELECSKWMPPQRRRGIDANAVEPRVSPYLSETSMPLPRVHLGLFASGDLVMKSGAHRDTISQCDDVIAFEMEAAGVWDTVPTIVIKAVCDYADSHKNKAWQKSAAVTAAACMKATLSTCTLASFGDAHKPVWTVPFHQNGGSVGRTQELVWLDSTLFSGSVHTKAAIEGLGGVGKSRLAVDFAYQVRETYPGVSVFWVQGTNESAFERDYRNIGRALRVSGCDDPNIDFKSALKHYLDQCNIGKWLLIFDNADDEALWISGAEIDGRPGRLLDYIPHSQHGSVLITTRNHRIAVRSAQKNVIRLSDLSEEDAVALLENLLIRPEILESTATITSLLERTTTLPLALVQAAAYMNENDLRNIEDYLSLFDATDENVIKLLSQDFDDENRYHEMQNPVATTWLISFDHIRQTYPYAADLLSCMACLDFKNIPKSALPLSASQDEMNKAFGTLTGYNLVQPRRTASASTLYDVHRLVHLATLNWLRRNGSLERWLRVVVQHLSEIFPYYDGTTDVSGDVDRTCTVYIPHAERICAVPQILAEHPRIQLLEKLARRLYSIYDYAKATKIYREMLPWREQRFGPGSGVALELRAMIGHALYLSHRLEEAEESLAATLAALQEVFGNEDVLTKRVMRWLAQTCISLQRYPEAEDFALRAVRSGQNFRESDLNTREHLSAMTTLAEVYRAQNKWPDAEQQALTVIEACRNQQLCEHPLFGECQNTLVSVYRDSGSLDKAEALQSSLVQKYTAKLGAQDHRTLKAEAALAGIWRDQRRLGEAASLFNAVLQKERQVRGEEDANVLYVEEEIARTRFVQGRYSEAERTRKEILVKAERSLGEEHLFTLTVINNLAWTQWGLHRPEEAVVSMNKCIALNARSATPDDSKLKEHQISLNWMILKLARVTEGQVIWPGEDDEDKRTLERERHLKADMKRDTPVADDCDASGASESPFKQRGRNSQIEEDPSLDLADDQPLEAEDPPSLAERRGVVTCPHRIGLSRERLTWKGPGSWMALSRIHQERTEISFTSRIKAAVCQAVLPRLFQGYLPTNAFSYVYSKLYRGGTSPYEDDL